MFDGERVSGTTQSTLSILNVTLQDQGMYQCSATNVDGVSALSANSSLILMPALEVKTVGKVTFITFIDLDAIVGCCFQESVYTLQPYAAHRCMGYVLVKLFYQGLVILYWERELWGGEGMEGRVREGEAVGGGGDGREFVGG